VTHPNPLPTPRRFEGRTVLVTGAGTGFGQSIAVRAAREGARAVGIHYRSSKAGAEETAAPKAPRARKPKVETAETPEEKAAAPKAPRKPRAPKPATDEASQSGEAKAAPRAPRKKPAAKPTEPASLPADDAAEKTADEGDS